MIMYEIIWSVFCDDYIIRKLCTFSSVPSEFLGTKEECINHLKKMKGQ